MENQTFKSFPPQVVEILQLEPNGVKTIPNGKGFLSIDIEFYKDVLNRAFGVNGWSIEVDSSKNTLTSYFSYKKDPKSGVLNAEKVEFVAETYGRLHIPAYNFVSQERQGVSQNSTAQDAKKGAFTALIKALGFNCFGIGAKVRKVQIIPINLYLPSADTQNPPYPFAEKQKPNIPAAPIAASTPKASNAPAAPKQKGEQAKVQIDANTKLIATDAVVASIKARVESATTPKQVNELRDKSLNAYDFSTNQIGVLKDAFTEGRLRTVKATIEKHAAARDFDGKQWARLEEFCKKYLQDYMDELSVLIIEAASYLESMPQPA